MSSKTRTPLLLRRGGGLLPLLATLLPLLARAQTISNVLCTVHRPHCNKMLVADDDRYSRCQQNIADGSVSTVCPAVADATEMKVGDTLVSYSISSSRGEDYCRIRSIYKWHDNEAKCTGITVFHLWNRLCYNMQPSLSRTRSCC